MVTDSDLQPYLVAMRSFMRQVREPDFRAYLARVDWSPDQDVVIAFDDETIAALVSRLAFNEASNPCLVAIPHHSERYGFRLMTMASVRRHGRLGRRLRGLLVRGQRIAVHPLTRVNPQATVGMLYVSLSDCGAYVPGEWTGGVTFNKVPEPV